MLFKNLLSPRRSTIRLCWSIFLGFIFYRSILYLKLLTLPVGPAMFVPDLHPFWASLYIVKSDFEASLVFAILFSLLCSIPLIGHRVKFRRALRLVILIGIGAICMTHYELLLTINKGFDMAALQEFGVSTWRDLWSYTTPLGLLFLFLPLGIDLILKRTNASELRYRFTRNLVILLVVLAYGMRLLPKIKSERELFANPTVYLMESVKTFYKNKNSIYRKMAKDFSPTQMASIRFTDPDLVRPLTPRAPDTLLPQPKGKTWNVIFLLLESTGEEYFRQGTGDGRLPMPFTAKLRAQGMSLNEHRSTGNTSFRSVFSIFTGLYPELAWTNFSLRATNCVPSFYDFMPEGQQRFMVLGSYLDFFFPKSLFINSGVTELLGAKEIQGPNSRPRPPDAVSDLDALDEFVERVRQSGEPFVAAFMPHGPHYDYFDYDPEHRFIQDPKTGYDRYLNNMHTVDRSIQRIYQELESKHALDNTILVVVGDHGEAFGQHPNNWTHSRGMFEENLRVPAFFWQPKLFRASNVDEPTDHTDILPTLLDAMGMNEDPDLFQGTALTKWQQPKIALPSFGNENSLCAIDSRTRRKICINEPRASCLVYDLTQDPKEQNPSDCTGQEKHLVTLMSVQKFQGNTLEAYNHAIRAGETIYGAVPLNSNAFATKRLRPMCQAPR